MNSTIINQHDTFENHSYIFENFDIEALTENSIAQRASDSICFDTTSCRDIHPLSLEINRGIFAKPYSAIHFPAVHLLVQGHQLILSCGCYSERGKLCEHEAQVLATIIIREELGVFFSSRLRHEKFKKFAVDYGLENEPQLDLFFQIEYINGKLVIKPGLPGLVSVTVDSIKAMRNNLMISGERIANPADDETTKSVCVVLRRHKFYKYLLIELYYASTTKDGKIKNPLSPAHPLDFIWQSDDPDHLKFFTGVAKFQHHSDGKRSESDIAALRAIIKNPGGYSFYYHDSELSENVNAGSVVPVKTGILSQNFILTVMPKGQFYELHGSLVINDHTYTLKDISIRFNYFVLAGDTLYLVDKLQILSVIDLLKKTLGSLAVHTSKYDVFKMQLLDKLQDKITIEYNYVKAATPVQLQQQGFNNQPVKIIYLSDFGSHVMIIPVMKYGEVEIPVRSKRQIYAEDDNRKEFIVKRNDKAEILFTALLLRQHAFIAEQIDNDLQYFYLHKKYFLEEEWFLKTFEDWRNEHITVLGFNEIEGNKLNPYKVKVDIRVSSGVNWFNTVIQVRFGKKKATLKHLHKAIRNKSKYVQLDDGTLGILPAAWIEKFSNYFNSGEIADEETLHISKINFSAIEQFYDENTLEAAVKQELKLYREKLADFSSIKVVQVPVDLNATLRPYQKQGLNWLNFLDDFNFGGCLADDMGLGKSIQIIAFILSQRKKTGRNTNLVVAPATLIFNWQFEVKKFAPSLQIHTIYGAGRIKSTREFDQYEIILTSYGTLMADIRFLKEYEFNYIFLDESQNIKNPETERYKAVRLLKSRNKITITGTPVENNSFDLYGQLSFACPGLLGTKQYFRDVYAIPIDKFKNSKRAVELQNKIRPFVFRRTKQQVAPELPDKTEMILYCEMMPEQRKIYDAYEKEFREYIAATTGEELKKSPMNLLKGLTKLRQICDAPQLLGGDELSGNTSAKIDMLIEQIEGKAPQHKILVFSQFVSMLSLIKKSLEERAIRFTWLTGSTRNRGAVVNEFQNNPDIKVFLISLKAGGTGLNLTEADYVYLVDPWWNPAVENQAIDRSHRIGQSKKVVAVRLICPDTIEEKIMKMQESKKVLAGDLINTDTSFLKSLSKEDLLSWFQ